MDTFLLNNPTGIIRITNTSFCIGPNSKPYLKKYTLNQVHDELTAEFKRLTNDDRRIAKGGSWISDLANISTGSRWAYPKNNGYSFVGFRIVNEPIKWVK